MIENSSQANNGFSQPSLYTGLGGIPQTSTSSDMAAIDNSFSPRRRHLEASRNVNSLFESSSGSIPPAVGASSVIQPDTSQLAGFLFSSSAQSNQELPFQWDDLDFSWLTDLDPNDAAADPMVSLASDFEIRANGSDLGHDTILTDGADDPAVNEHL